ncbi:TonB-dependent receptor [Sphingomonas corticis]|uniref:TonB-dependent receptor n=1 Tax=Sphingomonas corticis TaxID=2722791 RepID=A0ABX1CQ90_9SPHN|nr:TonB-dependent receptor [Sphingomonas corticis]NJR80074.1 TonB-dependent receptor [Sphingomonas corticis]
MSGAVAALTMAAPAEARTGVEAPVGAQADVDGAGYQTAGEPSADASATPAQSSTTDPSSSSGGDIVVTAQKRSQSVQDVPLSVVALGQDQLVEQRVETVSDLQRVVPNFTAQRGASVSNLRLNIRGIGAPGNTAIDQSVALFLDGVYVARPSAVYSSFLDIAAVEVVRGPQGTLFGRNTTAGGIILRSADPADATSQSAYVEAGNYGRYKTEAVANAALSDRLRLRAALQLAGTDGFGRNLLDGSRFGGQESATGRLGLGVDLTETLSWTGKFDFSHVTGDGQTAAEAIGATISGTQLASFAARLGGAGNLPELGDATDFRVNQITAGDLDDRQYGGSSTFVLSLGDWDVRLISGYRDYRNSQFDGEVLFVAVPLVSRNQMLNSESSSHELQIVSPSDSLLGGRLSFVGGLYYFQEDLEIGERLNLSRTFCTTFATGATQQACLRDPLAGATDLSFSQSGDSVAVYGQADLDVLPEVTLQLGARYTWDDKTGRFDQLVANRVATALRAPESVSLRFKDDRPTYRAALAWDAADDVHLFASYSTGYKAGGFNSGGGSAALGAARRTFSSETATNYELGVRTRFADRRVTLNATLYRIDLDSFQDRSFDGTSFVISNAGSLRHQGFEAEGRVAVTRGFDVSGSIAYLDSEFRSFRTASAFPGCSGASPPIAGCGPVGGDRTIQDLTGGRAHYAPEWQGALNATYETDVRGWGLKLTGGMTYIGEQFVGSVTDNNPQTIQRPFSLFNGRIALTPPGETFEIAVFGDNLTDKGYCPNILYQPNDSLFGVRNPATGGTLARCFPGSPRTYGASLRARF